MAVVKVRKQRKEALDEDLQTGMRVTHSWLVQMDAVADGDEFAARTAEDPDTEEAVPPMGDALEGLLLTQKSVRRVKGRVLQVTCVYSPPSFSFEPRPEGTDQKWNKSLSATGVQTNEGADRDATGKPLRNVLGDKYPIQLQKTYYDERISVSFDTDVLDADLIAAVRGDINTDQVTLTIRGVTRVFPPKTLKLETIDYRATVDSTGASAWHVDLVLLYRSVIGNGGQQVGWTRRIPQQGKRYKEGASGPIVDSNSVVFLAADGTKLAPGQNVVFDEYIFDGQTAFGTLLSGI